MNDPSHSGFTSCSIRGADVVDEWTFAAPDRVITPHHLSIGSTLNGNHTAKSVLPEGDYVANYSFSFSGLVSGLPGDDNAYCVYLVNASMISLSGLYSADFKKSDENPQLWKKVKSGYLCQANTACTFEKKN